MPPDQISEGDLEVKKEIEEAVREEVYEIICYFIHWLDKCEFWS